MGNFAGMSNGWSKQSFIHTSYEIRPTYRWFPFRWYDVLEVTWETDGTYVPVRNYSLLASKVPLGVAKVIVKTQED